MITTMARNLEKQAVLRRVFAKWYQNKRYIAVVYAMECLVVRWHDEKKASFRIKPMSRGAF